MKASRFINTQKRGMMGKSMMEWTGPQRTCPICGHSVSRWKDGRRPITPCYCCEDKLPWTHDMIAGKRKR